MREWILTAHHAEKLALSNEFDEIKSLVEKIGTNRRLLSQKTEFEFVRPYDLIPKYRAFCEARPAEGGASEQQNASEFEKCLNWSGWVELNHLLLAPEASGLPMTYTPIKPFYHTKVLATFGTQRVHVL